MEVQTASDHVVCTKSTRVNMEIGGEKRTIELIVIETCIYDLVIGLDAMKSFDISIYTKEEAISVNGILIPFKENNRVVLMEDIHLPANATAIVKSNSKKSSVVLTSIKGLEIRPIGKDHETGLTNLFLLYTTSKVLYIKARNHI